MGESKKPTKYVILSSVDGGRTWAVEGQQLAGSRTQALNTFYEKRDLPAVPPDGPAAVVEEGPSFQAVPESSWKAHKPKPPRPRVAFSEA